MERYETVKDLGSGKFGVAKLVIDKLSGEFFAVKFFERGKKIDELVKREIMNHRLLKHPSIIRFKEVLLTPSHLGIVMEYAAGGELYERICKRGRFTEDEARYFFQQLISGIRYCHSMQVCHRDLKLENTLLDGSPAPRVKICDFGYSKSSVFHSQPKSTVGTTAYIAPEVLVKKEYDGKTADVWSCGVTLYVMLVGAYPFQDPNNPKDVKKTMQRILNADFLIPNHVQLSAECRHILSSIFVTCPEKRITILGIQNHPWFLKNLPMEFMEGGSYQRNDINYPCQSFEDILLMLEEAKMAEGTKDGKLPLEGSMDFDDMDDEDEDVDDTDSSGEYVPLL